MCDPISIAGVALSGAGMAANSIAANEVASATNAATQQEQMLNQVQQQRADAANAKAAGEYKGFTAGQAAKGQQLGDVLGAAVNRPAPPSQMAPTNTQTQAAVSAGAAPTLAYSDQQAHALGNVRSFGDELADTNQAAVRDQVKAREATDFMKGNAGVLGLQLNDASHAGDTASLFGGVASGLGGLGIKAGVSGYGGVPGYGSPLGSLFGGDPTYYDVRQAGLDQGLKWKPPTAADPYGSVE